MTEDESTDASRLVDGWADGAAYESYVGRWSRPVARQFIDWLGVTSGSRWLDVGCGTGAVIETILARAQPDAVTGIDPSAAYLAQARATISDPRVRLEAGSAQALPEPSSSYDVVVSGLVLNFVLEPLDAMKELARVVRPGGTVAVYVWDYAERMQLMRYFWDAAIALDPGARDLDEGNRFSICDPSALATCLAAAGLREVETRGIEVATAFTDFDDYWSPFLAGQGPPAPTYVASLPADQRERLRARLHDTLPAEPDGTIRLVARAWAARGVR